MLLTERIAPTGADNVFSICAATAMRAPKELSPRHGAGREISKLRRLVARLRALRPRLVLGHVVRRRRFEQWTHLVPVSYTHLRAHETRHDLVCRLLLEKKK